MALTSQQDIPPQPKVESEPWSMRRLFPLGAIGTLSKVFVNAFDVLLGILILLLGMAVIIGRHVEWGFWILTISLVIADLLERRVWVQTSSVDESKKKKR